MKNHLHPALVFVFIICLLTAGHLSAQNLVPNPSFEAYGTCPTDLDQVSRATGWSKPTSGTSDFFHSCWTSGPLVADVPANTCGSQTARTGNGYGGFIPYAGFFPTDHREYLQIQLSSALTAGQQYLVSFYVSFADNYSDAVDAIGMYISSTAVGAANYDPLPYTPQISNPSGNIITDMSGWTLISGSYTAAGGERYITIGNFKNDASTNVSAGVGGGLYFGSYYYVEDVCVTPNGGTGCGGALPVTFTSFTAKQSDENSVLLEWSTSTEDGNDYFSIERSNDGKSFKTIGTVKSAKSAGSLTNYEFNDLLTDNADEPEGLSASRPASPRLDFRLSPIASIYYRLRQTDFDGQLTYSGTISVSLEQGEAITDIRYGAGNNGEIDFYLHQSSNLQARLFDVNGKEVFAANTGFLAPGDHTLRIGMLTPGIYCLKLSLDGREMSWKLVVGS